MLRMTALLAFKNAVCISANRLYKILGIEMYYLLCIGLVI